MLNLNTNWVSETIKYLHQLQAVIKTNFQAIQTAFNNHISGTGDRHSAQSIDYSGTMLGSNAKEALDNHINAVSGSRHNAQSIDYTGDMSGSNVKIALDNHIKAVSGSQHNAQDISYTGSVAGNNVNTAIDNLQGEIQNLSFPGVEHDPLVTGALIDEEGTNFGPEGTGTYLNGRLLKWEKKQLAHLLDIATHGTMARQAIINGNYDAWQRGTNFVNPAPGSYLADRWNAFYNVEGGTLPTNITISRQEVISEELANSSYFYRMSVDGAGSSFGANAYHITQQMIENGVKKLCGAGKKITVSFMARSSITGKRLGVMVLQNYGTGGSPSVQEGLGGNAITLTSTWKKYTFTFNTNTLAGKTFGTNNDDRLRLFLLSMWGTAYGGGNLSGASAETFVGAGNIDIAQVQLCAGDTALPFSPKSIAEELRACQRYYEVINAVSTYLYCDGTPRSLVYNFKNTKRLAPTCKVFDGIGNENKITYVTSGYVPENNKPLYGDVPTSTIDSITFNFVPPAGYIAVGFSKITVDAEL